MSIVVDEGSAAWDYYDLQDKIESWLHKSNVTSQIPDFISLAEDEINTEMRLRVMEVTESLTLESGENEVALPSRYIEPVSLKIAYTDREERELEFVNRSAMNLDTAAGMSSEPDYWAIDGSNIVVPCVADQDYTLSFRFLKRLDIRADLTNDLLTNYRGLYLYGALVQASAWLVNDKRVPQWIAMYDRLKAKVQKKESRNKALAALRTDHPSANCYRSNILEG
jgi:hypothetical protein